MKFKEGDLIKIADLDQPLMVFGVSHPWNNISEPAQYMVGEGDKFLPGFTGTWIAIEELDSVAELYEPTG